MADEAGGGVQQPVAQRGGLGLGERAVEQQQPRPAQQVDGDGGGGDSGGVDGERVRRRRNPIDRCSSAYRQRHPNNPDFNRWRRTADPINADHFVMFKGLAEVVQLELLVALQARTDAGTRTLVTGLRAIVSALRRNEAISIYNLKESDVARLRSDAAVLLRSLRTLLDRQLSTPETEREKVVWDLGVFGFAHWRLSFRDISQPWLLETAKRWTEDNLPQHRGRQGGGTAKTMIGRYASVRMPPRDAK